MYDTIQYKKIYDNGIPVHTTWFFLSFLKFLKGSTIKTIILVSLLCHIDVRYWYENLFEHQAGQLVLPQVGIQKYIV